MDPPGDEGPPLGPPPGGPPGVQPPPMGPPTGGAPVARRGRRSHARAAPTQLPQINNPMSGSTGLPPLLPPSVPQPDVPVQPPPPAEAPHVASAQPVVDAESQLGAPATLSSSQTTAGMQPPPLTDPQPKAPASALSGGGSEPAALFQPQPPSDDGPAPTQSSTPPAVGLSDPAVAHEVPALSNNQSLETLATEAESQSSASTQDATAPAIPMGDTEALLSSQPQPISVSSETAGAHASNELFSGETHSAPTFPDVPPQMGILEEDPEAKPSPPVATAAMLFGSGPTATLSVDAQPPLATSLFGGPPAASASTFDSMPPAAALFSAAPPPTNPSTTTADGPYGFAEFNEGPASGTAEAAEPTYHGFPDAAVATTSPTSSSAPHPGNKSDVAEPTMQTITKLLHQELQQERAQLKEQQEAQQFLMMKQFETMMSKMVSIAEQVTHAAPPTPPSAPLRLEDLAIDSPLAVQSEEPETPELEEKRRRQLEAAEAAGRKRQEMQLRLAELRREEEELELRRIEDIVRSKEAELKFKPAHTRGYLDDASLNDAAQDAMEPTTDFICYQTDDGESYYHNEQTGETVWEPPACWLAVHESVNELSKPMPPGPYTEDGLPDMRYKRNKLWYTRQGIVPEDPRYGKLDTEEEEEVYVQESFDEAVYRAPTPPPVRRHPIVSWGFGGKLLVCFPTAVQAQSHDASHDTGLADVDSDVFNDPPEIGGGEDDADGFQSAQDDTSNLVTVFDTNQLLASETEFQVLANGFLGPLDSVSVSSDSVTAFCERNAGECPPQSSEAVLWRLLGLLCRHNGTVRNGGRVNQAQLNDTATLDVVQMLREYSAILEPDVASSPTPASNPGQSAESLEHIQQLLAEGKKQRACEVAVQSNLWPHALVLSAKISQDYHNEVMRQFVHATMAQTPSMEILYSLYAGQIPTSAEIGTSGTQHWPSTLSTLLGNPVDGDISAIRQIGDARLNSGDVCGAHVCYLCADETPGSQWKETPRIVLVGGRPNSLFGDLVSIQRTEILEYARRLRATESADFTDFFVHKLVLTLWLCEAGRMKLALSYGESLVRLVSATPLESLLRVYSRGFIVILGDLVSRLREKCGVVRDSNTGVSVWRPEIRTVLSGAMNKAASPTVESSVAPEPAQETAWNGHNVEDAGVSVWGLDGGARDDGFRMASGTPAAAESTIIASSPYQPETFASQPPVNAQTTFDVQPQYDSQPYNESNAFTVGDPQVGSFQNQNFYDQNFQNQNQVPANNFQYPAADPDGPHPADELGQQLHTNGHTYDSLQPSPTFDTGPATYVQSSYPQQPPQQYQQFTEDSTAQAAPLANTPAFEPPVSPTPSSTYSKETPVASPTDEGAVTNPFELARRPEFMSPFGVPAPANTNAMALPSLDAQPALPQMALPAQPPAEQPVPHSNTAASQEAEKEPATDAKNTAAQETSGGWFSGLATGFKSLVSDPKEMKLPSGPDPLQWDSEFNAYVPTDPEERKQWIADREKSAAPPPPAAASVPATPQGDAAAVPQTPRTGLSNPLDVLGVPGSHLRTNKKKRTRAYAANQGLSPAQHGSSPLAPPPL